MLFFRSVVWLSKVRHTTIATQLSHVQRNYAHDPYSGHGGSLDLHVEELALRTAPRLHFRGLWKRRLEAGGHHSILAEEIARLAILDVIITLSSDTEDDLELLQFVYKGILARHGQYYQHPIHARSQVRPKVGMA